MDRWQFYGIPRSWVGKVSLVTTVGKLERPVWEPTLQGGFILPAGDGVTKGLLRQPLLRLRDRDAGYLDIGAQCVAAAAQDASFCAVVTGLTTTKVHFVATRCGTLCSKFCASEDNGTMFHL